MELALTIVAIGSTLGSFVLWATLLTEDRAARRAIERHDAAHDLVDQGSHGDWPVVPSISSFHRVD
jgi:hypothetical protein